VYPPHFLPTIVRAYREYSHWINRTASHAGKNTQPNNVALIALFVVALSMSP